MKNDEEFGEWFKHHSARFSGLGPWFAKQPEQYAVRKAWQHAMWRIDLDDAKAASDMMAEDDDLVPMQWDRHRSTVIRLARQIARQRQGQAAGEMRIVDGEVVYRCPQCQDSGGVTIWTPEAMRVAKQGIEAVQRFVSPEVRRMLGAPPMTRTVACTCDEAELRYGNWKLPMPAYDKSLMVLVRNPAMTDDPDEQQRLVDWMRRTMPVGAHEEFVDFGRK